MSNSLLTACLIVRNESSAILPCLQSLTELCDEVVVLDTGSTDHTVASARSAGVKVIEGQWHDDFARARNEALAHCSSTWVLSVDADEVLVSDGAALRATLSDADDVDAYLVDIAQAADTDGAYRSHSAKLFRRDRSIWAGLVHERLVSRDETPLRLASLPAATLSLSHAGYVDPRIAKQKCRRNAAIGLTELRSLNEAAVAEVDEQVRVLLDLGRSLMGCDQHQAAADAFAGVRGFSLPHSDVRWLQASELLAGLALGSGQAESAAEIVAQLRAAGAPVDYTDWLGAQALAQLGQPDIALTMLASITELVDSAGRSYDLGQLVEMRALIAALAGDVDQAVELMIETMARYGRITGRGALLRLWWADRPTEDLWDSVEAYGVRHLGRIRAELDFAQAA